MDRQRDSLIHDALCIFVIHLQKQIGLLRYHTFEPEKNPVARRMIEKFEGEIRLAREILETFQP